MKFRDETPRNSLLQTWLGSARMKYELTSPRAVRGVSSKKKIHEPTSLFRGISWYLNINDSFVEFRFI